MKDEQIIKKAIRKAFDRRPTAVEYSFPQTIIFNHVFAEAFWGEENGSPCISSSKSGEHEHCKGWHEDKDRPKLEGYYPKWAYCLGVMVLEEKPLKYIEKYL